MVRVGIVGCGNIGKVHAEVLKNMKHIQIQAFVDKNLENALKLAKIYGGDNTGCYSSLSEMLSTEEIDVLHICTPHYLHVSMAKEALARKIHVFMEKPPAISKEEFFSLKEAKNQSGKEVGICFQNRYNKTTEKICDSLKNRTLGKIKGARAFLTWNRQAGYYEESGWRGMWSMEGGGVLINQAIHTLDLLTYFFGKAEQVEVSMHNHHLKNVIEVEDTIEAYYNHFLPEMCAFMLRMPMQRTLRYYWRLYVKMGKSEWKVNDWKLQKTMERKYAYDFTKKERWEGKKYWGNSHQTCIQDFYDSIAAGRAYRNRLESVENTFELTWKCMIL